MIQPGATVGGEQAGLDGVLTCRCWDCAAYRGHLIRRVALFAVLLGLSCGLALRSGAWNGELAARTAPTTESIISWL